MMHFKKIKFFILCMGVLFGINAAAKEFPLTLKKHSSIEIPAPKKNYRILFTLNSQHGSLVKISPGHYKLVLDNIDESVNYLNKIHPNIKKYYNIKSFLKLWQPNSHVESDITGVQVNHKTMGHTQFYTSSYLFNPNHVIKNKQLVFKINLKNRHESLIKFKNATVFLNGCDLLNCSPAQ